MKKNIVAKTFTPIYDELEDRLRLAVNYNMTQNRVDFMITRSFILNLLPSAEEFIDNNYGLTQEQDITQNYPEEASEKTDAVDLELFRTEDQLLLEVNFTFAKQTKLTQVTFKSKHITAVTTLDYFSFLNLIKVIKSSLPSVIWGISLKF